MISESTAVVFPNNAVSLIATRMAMVDSDLFVTRRPLRETDPNQSIGVFGTLWTPVEDSHEMIGVPSFGDPTLEQYLITIHALIKDTEEARGLAAHSVLSEVVRGVLYRDAGLKVGLAALNTELNGVKKRYTRSGVRQQRYVSNELSGAWLYLSTLEFWVETETF